MSTRSQRQDNLVKMYPGTAKVIRRPKTNPDGSEIVTRSDYEFPDVSCESHMQNLYQVRILPPYVRLHSCPNWAFQYNKRKCPWSMLVVANKINFPIVEVDLQS